MYHTELFHADSSFFFVLFLQTGEVYDPVMSFSAYFYAVCVKLYIFCLNHVPEESRIFIEARNIKIIAFLFR